MSIQEMEDDLKQKYNEMNEAIDSYALIDIEHKKTEESLNQSQIRLDSAQAVMFIARKRYREASDTLKSHKATNFLPGIKLPQPIPMLPG